MTDHGGSLGSIVETIDQSEEPLLRAREAMVAATLFVTARRSG
jgi:hypothetical protein